MMQSATKTGRHLYGRGARRIAFIALLLAASSLESIDISRAEVIGKVTQPLVAGTEVSAQEQQQQALVSVKSSAGGCSGTLLNSEWVVSAAHCFQDPDVKASAIAITAKWSTTQKRTGKELHILEKDIAIVRVDRPFDNVSVSYNLPVFSGVLTPGRSLKIYGRGISVLASGSGDTAVPSMNDSKYRTADFQVTRVDGDHIWFGPGKAGAIPAGGDSGGPAFINAGGQMTLAGISSLCQTSSIPGKPQDKDRPWRWVNKIEECGYAPLTEVWPQILLHIGSSSCRNYAWRAVGPVKYAKDQNCDPNTISGPRFSPNFDDHLNYCKVAKASDANFEDKERFRISQECRIAAGKPHGNARLTIAKTGSDFSLSGGGYAANTRVIIRTTDAAGAQNNITSNRSDAQGNFTATVAGSLVCTKEGQIVFTAEDQDNKPSPPVTMTCARDPAAEAKAEDARRKQREFEIQVTGRTAEQCMQASNACQARMRAQLGPVNAIGPIATECLPYQQQCLANAAIEAAGSAPAPNPERDPQRPAGGGTTAKVVQSVDVYDAPDGNGNKIGTLQKGRTVTVLGPCKDDWCHVSGRRVPTGDGFVYSGESYRSLEF